MQLAFCPNTIRIYHAMQTAHCTYWWPCDTLLGFHFILILTACRKAISPRFFFITISSNVLYSIFVTAFFKMKKRMFEILARETSYFLRILHSVFWTRLCSAGGFFCKGLARARMKPGFSGFGSPLQFMSSSITVQEFIISLLSISSMYFN